MRIPFRFLTPRGKTNYFSHSLCEPRHRQGFPHYPISPAFFRLSPTVTLHSAFLPARPGGGLYYRRARATLTRMCARAASSIHRQAASARGSDCRANKVTLWNFLFPGGDRARISPGRKLITAALCTCSFLFLSLSHFLSLHPGDTWIIYVCGIEAMCVTFFSSQRVCVQRGASCARARAAPLCCVVPARGERRTEYNADGTRLLVLPAAESLYYSLDFSLSPPPRPACFLSLDLSRSQLASHSLVMTL